MGQRLSAAMELIENPRTVSTGAVIVGSSGVLLSLATTDVACFRRMFGYGCIRCAFT